MSPDPDFHPVSNQEEVGGNYASTLESLSREGQREKQSAPEGRRAAGSTWANVLLAHAVRRALCLGWGREVGGRALHSKKQICMDHSVHAVDGVEPGEM